MRLLNLSSPLQTIELYRLPGDGLVLVMDGTVQVRESNEHRYHECLAVVPTLYGRPRHVFIGGGGDGLAATRLLKFDSVESIVVCDYDPAITEVSRTHPELTRLNAGSLDDPRVAVVNEDAYAWLAHCNRRFDLVICDFPDALFAEVERLYSRQFYEIARRALADDGILVTQTLAVPACARRIGASIGAVFPHRRFYRHGAHGFTLASPAPLVRAQPVPEWTRFLSEAYVDCLFQLPKDDALAFGERDEPVEEGSGSLLREAVLQAHGRTVAYPADEEGQSWIAEVRAGTDRRLQGRLAMLIEGLSAEAPLTVRLDVQAEDADRGAVAAFEPTGRTTRLAVLPVDMDVARLAARIWQAEGGTSTLEEDAPRLLSRDAEGSLTASWLIVPALEGLGLRWAGPGEPTAAARQSLLLCVAYLAELDAGALTLENPTEDQDLLLTRLGRLRLYDFQEWAVPRSTT